MKKISICIPVFNEEENITLAYQEVSKLFKTKLQNYNYEIIFTDNHSSDKTEEIISQICERDKKIKYLRFKKNLDYDKSILEGYSHSTGDAVIVIDCDLQDPPELFENFLKKWEEGHDLVYGKVESRKESWIMNYLRKIYYKLMNQNSLMNYPKDAHDFRLIDKMIVEQIKMNNLLFPYVRGLTFSLAKKPIGIPYFRNKRKKGSSKLGIYNTFTYAINAFLEETFIFTTILRRIVLFLFLFSSIFTLANISNKFVYLTLYENLIIIFFIFLSFFLSIILEYITRIYFQLKKMKTNIYEKKINI